MINKCPICEVTSDSREYIVKEMMFGYGEKFKYLLCKNCYTLYLYKIPSDLSKYYEGEYYSYSTILDQSSSFRKRLRFWRDNILIFGMPYSRLLVKLLTQDSTLDFIRSLNLSKQSKILDVGSGSGMLLYRLSESGFSNITGIDPYISENLSYKNGLNIYKKHLEEIEDAFDFISFHHSFEHIENPLEVLGLAKKNLSKYGVIMIRIPVIPSFAWRKYRENWVQIDAPRHLHILSVKSIKVLADKVGLYLYKVEYDSKDFQFWGSEQYQRGIALNSESSYLKNPKNSIFSKLDILKYRVHSKILNVNQDGDQAIIYLTNNSQSVSTL